MKRTYALVVGTRPELIKLAALIHKAKEQPDIELLLVHTGQHFDDNMSEIFFKQLELPPPDIHLEVTGAESSERIGSMLAASNDALMPLKDSLSGIISLGDTNSTLVAGITASRLGVPLVHVEAGLRSRDPRMPEESNRIVIDHLSAILFTTEESGSQNLLKEKIVAEKVHLVGNIGIESLDLYKKKIEVLNTATSLGLVPRQYLVATIHRQEHTGDKNILENIFKVLGKLAESAKVVIPLHPATRKRLEQYSLQSLLAPLTVVEPLGFFEFMSLVMESSGVLTDSGGIQEETSHLGIPCATLRDNTERPVTLALGSNKLFSTSALGPESVDDIKAHLARRDFKKGEIPLWDTQVSARIFKYL